VCDFVLRLRNRRCYITLAAGPITQDVEVPTPEPQRVSDETMAFPERVMHLLPPHDAIPTDYVGREYFQRLQTRWFNVGLVDAEIPEVREGFNRNECLRHLSVLQRSFEPPHEHKCAAVAWLMSLWFKVPGEAIHQVP
jgi:hypothetical protein